MCTSDPLGKCSNFALLSVVSEMHLTGTRNLSVRCEMVAPPHRKQVVRRDWWNFWRWVGVAFLGVRRLRAGIGGMRRFLRVEELGRLRLREESRWLKPAFECKVPWLRLALEEHPSGWVLGKVRGWAAEELIKRADEGGGDDGEGTSGMVGHGKGRGEEEELGQACRILHTEILKIHQRPWVRRGCFVY